MSVQVAGSRDDYLNVINNNGYVVVEVFSEGRKHSVSVSEYVENGRLKTQMSNFYVFP